MLVPKRGLSRSRLGSPEHSISSIPIPSRAWCQDALAQAAALNNLALLAREAGDLETGLR